MGEWAFDGIQHIVSLMIYMLFMFPCSITQECLKRYGWLVFILKQIKPPFSSIEQIATQSVAWFFWTFGQQCSCVHLPMSEVLQERSIFPPVSVVALCNQRGSCGSSFILYSSHQRSIMFVYERSGSTKCYKLAVSVLIEKTTYYFTFLWGFAVCEDDVLNSGDTHYCQLWEQDIEIQRLAMGWRRALLNPCRCKLSYFFIKGFLGTDEVSELTPISFPNAACPLTLKSQVWSYCKQGWRSLSGSSHG